MLRLREALADRLGLQYPVPRLIPRAARAPFFLYQMPWWMRLGIASMGAAMVAASMVALFFLALLMWAVVTTV